MMKRVNGLRVEGLRVREVVDFSKAQENQSDLPLTKFGSVWEGQMDGMAKSIMLARFGLSRGKENENENENRKEQGERER